MCNAIRSPASWQKIWAEQNQAAFEAIVWREAAKWNRLDARFERHFSRLGLDARSWKNGEELALAFSANRKRLQSGPDL